RSSDLVMLTEGSGLSEETAFRILWPEYNPRCQPPWSEKELRHKAKGAARANLPDGFKLETDREWQPRNRIPEPPPVDDDGPWDYADVAEGAGLRSEEHTSELQSRENLVCRLLLEKKKTTDKRR